VDDELVSIAREAIATRYGLSPQQARRLRGDTASALVEDAKLMRSELGLAPVDEGDRDERGRFRPRSMNEAIRQAAGR
jgi:hypothetical protein